jgi:thioredoxin reductase
MKQTQSMNAKQDFWSKQADALFSNIEKNGIDFVLNATPEEIEEYAHDVYLKNNDSVRGSIVAVMRTMLREGKLCFT